MKRDWDLLRKQLTDIEEGNDVLAEIPDVPKWTDDLQWDDYERLMTEQKSLEERIAGHLELLIDSGYVEGLTMAGHDLLDTMRSSTVWEKIKSTAKKKGVELTFDSIKALAGFTLKQMLG